MSAPSVYCKVDSRSTGWAVSTNGSTWVSIYYPSNDLKIEHTNVTGSSTGRGEDGYMVIDWVRRDVRKVNLTYKVMTGAELRWLKNSCFGSYGICGRSFYLRYREDEQYFTMHCYCGEFNYTYETDGVEGKGMYTDVECHCIEI